MGNVINAKKYENKKSITSL